MSKHAPSAEEWDEAVRVVDSYLQVTGLNRYQLALKAGLSPSVVHRFLNKETFPELPAALALYVAMQESLDRGQRGSFQRVSGLEKLLLALEQNSVYLVNLHPEHQAANPYMAGLQQMMIAESHSIQAWEEAIFYYRRAEELFSHSAVSHAANAACKIVQMQINLGEYAAAHQEIDHIHELYGKTKDIETDAELARLNGWLDFHEGRYLQAKSHFERQLALAQQAGVEHLQNSAHGFLGRIYVELATQAASRKEKGALYFKAQEHSELDRLFFIRQGWHEGIAMSTFRLSQALHASGNHTKAKDLRQRVRTMIGTNPFAQLDVDEARLALENQDGPYSKFLIDRALEYLEAQKYARGISQALQLQAMAELSEGRPTSAFELAITSLCISPSDNDARYKKLLEFVRGIDPESVWKGKWKSYEAYQRHLQEAALAQSGNFRFLKSVSFLDGGLDGGDVVQSLLSQL